MTDLTNMTHNDIAAYIIAGFEELNRRNAEHNRNQAESRRKGMGWLKPASIDDEPLMEMLDAVTSWDADPLGTLETVRQDNGCYAEPEWNGRWPAASDASDVEFDYANSRGISL